MFDRDKKEQGSNEGMDSRPAAPQRSHVASAPRPASHGGDVAVIGRSIQINGDVRGDEDLRIEGDISGTVQLKNSNLTIGKEGKVRADVYAKSITVHGTTEGDLYATECVTVHIDANVRGNITAPKVGLEQGAKFKGSIEMDQQEVEKALGNTNRQANSGQAADRQPAKPAGIAPTNAVKGAAAS